MRNLNYMVPASLENSERRKHKREPHSAAIKFSLNDIELHQLKKITAGGTTLDISNGGISLLTDYPIEPGHVLIFNNGKNPVPPGVGIVKWVRSEGVNIKGGVEFIGEPELSFKQAMQNLS
ncbi:MAG: PilZ domain-containing protein [Nitrospirae bacterium]|nr:PilZ domain-containing protein [Nitrospirota bacterium]